MDAAKSPRTADGIVVASKHEIPPHTPPIAIAAALPLPLFEVATKPRKLTPLEKKDRDRLRMKEQGRRRQQAIKDQYDQAKRLTQEQQSSSMWHRQERQEEELVLRRLERDTVDVQRLHPAAAGYSFDSPSQSVTTSSPVFISYSHALCSASQAPRRELQSRGGLHKVRNVPVEAEYVHPACQGYAMAKHDDSHCISPVFFFTGFAKIPLDKVVMEKDDDQSEDEEDEEQENDNLEEGVFDGKGGVSDVSDAAKARQQETQRRLQAAMAVRRSLSTTLVIDESDEAAASPPECLICKQRDVTQGCPGCFSFSGQKYRESEASKANQRLKTPKTHLQEEQDRCARHKALQKQLIMPPLVARSPQQRPDGPDKVTVTFSVKEETQEDENGYYSNVLADFRAIRKHRSMYVSPRSLISEAWGPFC
ncbi:hypothetical protein BBJ28_00002920 [Nothophytophthora sp. Chile5]|nr:hypothetical protein BBJ28_00002920 [Nothophytophthora sp. Chile5]